MTQNRGFQLLQRLTLVAPMLLPLAITGCGDSDPLKDAEAQRGTLVGQASITVPASGSGISGANVLTGFDQLAVINPLINSFKNSLPLLNGTQVAGNPKTFPCGFSVSKITYNTVGAQGEAATATAAVMLPQGDAAPCKANSYPVVLAAHGTNIDKTFDAAKPDNFNASNGNMNEPLSWALMYAAQGYVVVAPNYAGYDTSSLSYHPYMLMEQQAKDMLDAYTAAKSGAANLFVSNDKIFLAGYSQGGAVAVATQRALQALGKSAVAVAGLSGPYAMLDFGDAILSGKVNRSANFFAPLIIQSYQKAYGNLYAQPSDVYTSTFTAAAGLLPTSDMTFLSPSGQPTLLGLLASPTTALLPSLASDTYTHGIGAVSIINAASRNAYLQDIASAKASYPLRKALQTNDLRSGWNPAAPMLLCGASNDGTVFFNENTLGFADYVQKTRLVATGTAAPFSVLDLNSGPKSPDDGFNQIRAAYASNWGTVTFEASRTGNSSSTNVHGEGAPPFCYSASLAFFTQVTASPKF